LTRRVCVTGGGGFIGAYLTKRLLRDGWKVIVIDNLSRGEIGRLAEVIDDVQFLTVDVRDEDRVADAIRGCDVVMHLAAINGTNNFYLHPELVLDVGLRGALAVVNGCRRVGVPDLVLASSAEVYQTPQVVPTPETIPLMLPDSLNPRYSYGGSKIVSELIAFDYAREHFRKVQVFRPHNIYGPNMGWKHVIPQLILRAACVIESRQRPARVPIQGDGRETRAFCYVDDAVDGILTMYERGGHREIYHIGHDEEISILNLLQRLGVAMEAELIPTFGKVAPGGTPRRCPDISKMRALGYQPRVNLDEGLRRTTEWYLAHRKPPTGNQML
jgi:nucleoside-diphosphate-sugar epimerase